MPKNWERAGLAVKHRRLDLKLSQRRCGVLADVSPTTWGHVESGQPVSEMTRRAAAEVLGWPAEAIDLIAEGADPDDIPTHETTAHMPHEDRLSAIEEEQQAQRAMLESIVADLRSDRGGR